MSIPTLQSQSPLTSASEFRNMLLSQITWKLDFSIARQSAVDTDVVIQMFAREIFEAARQEKPTGFKFPSNGRVSEELTQEIVRIADLVKRRYGDFDPSARGSKMTTQESLQAVILSNLKPLETLCLDTLAEVKTELSHGLEGLTTHSEKLLAHWAKFDSEELLAHWARFKSEQAIPQDSIEIDIRVDSAMRTIENNANLRSKLKHTSLETLLS